MYTITGVTGHVGSVAAQTLLSQNKRVRVLVRDAAKGEPWAKQGADVVIGTFHDHAALVKAFTGVDGAFVLIPPAEAMGAGDPIAYNAQIAEKIAAAVRASGLKHLVLLSSVGAQHADGTGPIKALNRAEKILAGPHLTAVRPAYFQENWATSLGALAQNILPSFVDKSVRYAQVATADIGRTVAAALVEGTRGVIELAGPRDYTGDEVAAALSTVVGTPIAAIDVPKDQQLAGLTGHGVPEPAAKLFVEMYRGIESGTVAFEGTPRRGTVEVSATLSKLLGK
ncbi:MAG: NAD(P)H-binding protein [Kofleriaceae bacterium]